MKYDLQRKGGDVVIVAGGQLTFSHAVRLHKELLEAFADAGRVDLFLHDVREADLSFLQLLCAAHRTAAERGCAFTVGGLDAASPVLRLIREAGAERELGCPEGCLWAGALGAENGAAVPQQATRVEP